MTLAKAANRRIRLLLAVFVLALRAALRPRGLAPGRARAARSSTGADASSSETSTLPAGRGTIFDRTRRPARDRRAGDDRLRRPAPDARPARASRSRRRRPRARPGRRSTRARRPVAAASSTSQRKADPAQARPLAEAQARRRSASIRRSGASYPQDAVARAGARLRGRRQQGARRARAPARPRARGAARARRRSSSDPSAARSTSLSSTPEREGRDVFLTLDHTIQAKAEAVLRQTVSAVAREGGDRRRARPAARAACSRWRARRGSTRTASRQAPARRSATAPSPTRTSRARRSSSSPSRRALSEGLVTPTTTFTLPYSIQVADRVDPRRRAAAPRR